MGNGLWLPPRVRQESRSTTINQVGVYLPVYEVFPGVEATEGTLKSLLSTLSRTDALLWCARLNLIVSNPNYHDQFKKQLYCLQNFLSMDEMRKVRTAQEVRGRSYLNPSGRRRASMQRASNVAAPRPAQAVKSRPAIKLPNAVSQLSTKSHSVPSRDDRPRC